MHGVSAGAGYSAPVEGSHLALTMVLRPPGRDSGTGDGGADVAASLERGFLSGTMMRLWSQKEETRLLTHLAAAAGTNCSCSDKQKAKETSSNLNNIIYVDAQSTLGELGFKSIMQWRECTRPLTLSPDGLMLWPGLISK